jgi:hypothetical protein
LRIWNRRWRRSRFNQKTTMSFFVIGHYMSAAAMLRFF